MTKVYVLDACALIAFINGEPGAAKVKTILTEALAGNNEVYMNKFNAYEVYYGFYKDEGKQKADEIYGMILRLPISIIDTFEDNVFSEAARLKTRYGISIADSIALGESVVRDAFLATSDHQELDIVEQQEQIKFFWIR